MSPLPPGAPGRSCAAPHPSVQIVHLLRRRQRGVNVGKQICSEHKERQEQTGTTEGGGGPALLS